jgi:hypothetical protein
MSAEFEPGDVVLYRPNAFDDFEWGTAIDENVASAMHLVGDEFVCIRSKEDDCLIVRLRANVINLTR